MCFKICYSFPQFVIFPASWERGCLWKRGCWVNYILLLQCLLVLITFVTFITNIKVPLSYQVSISNQFLCNQVTMRIPVGLLQQIATSLSRAFRKTFQEEYLAAKQSKLPSFSNGQRNAFTEIIWQEKSSASLCIDMYLLSLLF